MPSLIRRMISRISQLWRFRSCLIIDDRNRKIELLNPFSIYFSGRDDVIERPVLKSIINSSADSNSRKLQLSLLFSIVFFLAMAYFVFWPEYQATRNFSHSLGQAVRSPVIYFALGYGVLVIPWQLQAQRRIRRQHITKALLELGRCAHCGYNLEGLETDADDCATVCSECRCAWKLDKASVSHRSGDELQSRREMKRFSIIVGIVITIIGLNMGLYYIL